MVCRSQGAEARWVCQEPLSCSLWGLRGSPVGSGLLWIGPGDKSWMCGEVGLGFRVGSLAEAVRKVAPLAANSFSIAGQRSLPLFVCPLRSANARLPAHILTALVSFPGSSFLPGH